jgi:hypothetical protein
MSQTSRIAMKINHPHPKNEVEVTDEDHFDDNGMQQFQVVVSIMD